MNKFQFFLYKPSPSYRKQKLEKVVLTGRVFWTINHFIDDMTNEAGAGLTSLIPEICGNIQDWPDSGRYNSTDVG